MSDQLWPANFRAACEGVFGRLDNTTYKMLNRRVVHAFDVWRQRYGGLTPSQHLYAWEQLHEAVIQGSAAATAAMQSGNVAHEFPYRRKVVCAVMESRVHDELTHAGFKSRAELVDVSAELATLSS